MSTVLRVLSFEFTTKLQDNFLNKFSNFYTEISNDTIQSLKCVVGQIVSNFSTVVYYINLQLCSYLFLVFFQKSRFLFFGKSFIGA